METANKHVAAIFRNYSETMKSIRQHCGSHFSYLVTGLTDRVQVYGGRTDNTKDFIS